MRVEKALKRGSERDGFISPNGIVASHNRNGTGKDAVPELGGEEVESVGVIDAEECEKLTAGAAARSGGEEAEKELERHGGERPALLGSSHCQQLVRQHPAFLE